MSGGELRYWRNAATLIIAGKVDSSSKDYKVLMLERSKGSKFFPGAYVFPGGEVSEADFSPEWSQIFTNVVSMTTDDVTKDLKVPGDRPPLMTTKNPLPSDVGQGQLDPCLAYRICAIRETFEESGLFLATKQSGNRSHLSNSGSMFENNNKELNGWREKVNKEPWNFLAMCREMNVVPDVWALREWSNWLTPVMKQVKRPSPRPHRFDTFFYLCCLDHLPVATQDSLEITSTRWVVPRELVGQTISGKFRGPQGYEMSRLANFPQIQGLFSYICQREPLGIEQWLPVIVACQDGIVSLMPGDGIYPQNPDRTGKDQVIVRTETVEELRKATRHLHRNEQSPEGNFRFVCNINLKCGQIAPMHHQLSSY